MHFCYIHDACAVDVKQVGLEEVMGMILNLIDRIFSVVGALVLCQAPQFMRQYESILTGHALELNRQVNLLKETAQAGGKTVDAYIAKFLAHPDMDFSRQGEWMNQVISRCQQLSESLHALQSASAFKRPFIFLQYVSYDIVQETAAHFIPGIVFNLEMVLYGLVGILLGLGCFSICKKCLLSLWQLLKKPFYALHKSPQSQEVEIQS